MPAGPKRPPAPGLALKLAAWILASTTAIFTAAFAYYYFSSKAMLLAEVRENAANLIRGSAARLEGRLTEVTPIPLYLARRFGQHIPDAAELDDRLADFLSASPTVYGTAAAFAPGVFAPGVSRYAPYFCRKDGRPTRVPLGYEARYELENWYLLPEVLGRPVWTEPYFDESGGDVVMATYGVPFFRSEGGRRQFLGVVTADVSLDWLREQVEKIRMFRTGYAFVVSATGVFVTHPDKRLVMRESVFSLAEALGSQKLRTIGQDMIHGGTGFVRLPELLLGRPAWLAYAPLPQLGWSMGVVVPEDELFAGLNHLSRQVAYLGAGGFLLLLCVIAAIAASITRPLSRLAATAGEIARGDLDTPVPVAGSGDEVGRLARSFEQMRLALKEYIADLTATTKAKERLESELKIARGIQMNFLPKRFPPFPEITDFSLHAVLIPAWEVGGDLYDFSLLGPDKLLVLVGDVSGKGVPAALFMAVTKTLIKGIAEQETDPAAILAKVNRELCVDNDSLLFVTMFLAILDIPSGRLSYSNAGHNPPALIAPDGTVAWLPLPRGVFLGIMEDAVYKTASVTLAPGAKLTAFTDGVTEAMDARQALFGTARLETVLAATAGGGPEAVDEAVLAAVRDFAGQAEQADDITVLTLLYRGSPKD
jgi:sigma-B regulation protein RsbU (phosphoserine phosphatase)